MKRTNLRRAVLALLLSLTLLCSGCSATAQSAVNFQKFSRVDMTVFDTVITLMGFAPDQAAFDKAADRVMNRLHELDRAFDAYNGYDGLHNLYYINRHANQRPVEIPDDLFLLISWCKEQWDAGCRETNIAMGAVLSIWHEYRTAGMAQPDQAKLPPMDMLQAASQHVSFDDVVLDEEHKTVFFSDPEITLDLGSVAKGWAADETAKLLYEDMPSFLLSLGGNVYAGNPPMDGRSNWAVGVENPDVTQTAAMDILDVHDKTTVTSGDYRRFYTVDGQRYHHIIDPETLMPSTKMVSVTIVCESSVLADFLSTALFVLSYEEGRAVADSLDGVEAMWILPDGTIHMTDGMRNYARSAKNPA